MINARKELLDLLNSGQPFVMADLYSFGLSNGVVLRYTTADIDLYYDGNTYKSSGLAIKRNSLKVSIGIEVDTLDLEVIPDDSIVCNGMTFGQLTTKGLLDRALVKLERAFMTDWGMPVVGTVTQYLGWVGDIDGGRTKFSVKVKSILELLNIKMPRNIVQASCSNTLFDTCCGLDREAYAISGVTGVSSNSSLIQISVSRPTGYFDLGVIEYTSGLNAGIKRTIRTHAGSQVLVILPFPNTPAVGDTFKLYPGCDKTKATCQNKFNNLGGFRGCPYVPVPEVMY
jgi:uncharacterized phage protein (TIGR02218 family)